MSVGLKIASRLMKNSFSLAQRVCAWDESGVESSSLLQEACRIGLSQSVLCLKVATSPMNGAKADTRGKAGESLLRLLLLDGPQFFE
jgi:hypothetical protein